MRTGTLIRDTVYLIHKWWGDDGTKHRESFTAPVGSRVEWTKGTNEGFEDCYGDRKLYWATIVGYGDVGLEEGVDFVWDN